MKRALIIMTIFTAAAVSQSKVGSSAASFLGVGIGSRAIGMGGAFSAEVVMLLSCTGIQGQWQN